LGETEFEFGIGIHGEPGRQRLPMRVADEIVEMMVLAILDDGPYTRTVREWDRQEATWVDKTLTDESFKPGDQVIAFVNSMGGTPLSELYIVYRKMADVLKQRGVAILRNLVGPYITSLEMQGISITLLKADEEILRFWDAPVHTPGLRWGM
jgi:dihydroxyacetone kinase-like protein